MPTPPGQLKARGSWRAKTRAGEPSAPAAAPSCPRFLDDEARAEWKRQVEELLKAGLLAKVDRAALTVWCRAWSEYARLAAKVMNRSLTAKGASRLAWRLDKLEERLLKVAAQFGFTPAARSRLRSEQGEPPADSMEAFFERSAN